MGLVHISTTRILCTMIAILRDTKCCEFFKIRIYRLENHVNVCKACAVDGKMPDVKAFPSLCTIDEQCTSCFLQFFIFRSSIHWEYFSSQVKEHAQDMPMKRVIMIGICLYKALFE